jgi:hypothetical protein
MRVALSLRTAGLCLGLAQAAAASPYDGAWTADIPAQNGCNFTGTMSVLVAGHDVSGRVHNGGSVQGEFTGRLDDAGDANITVNGRYPGTMRFTADHFEVTWNNGDCDRHAEGDRAIEGDQAAVLAAQRKQHQDAYADLIARAEAGDRTVDYTQLRHEAVYAKGWDFYDTKANGLVDQANAAVKGKDCAAAMAALDQAAQLDFTIDSAHALRSDCLRDGGDEAKARIEDAIAKGLIHSLMDSGDGKTEHSAYVVVSQREEDDVLANRNILFHGRDTEVRGADGRYYDVVHGVAFIAGSPLKRDVYFDISAFMAGRASERAALAVAASSAQ